MAILVTGASGFVGGALIPRLLEQGHKVYGVSRHPPFLMEGWKPNFINVKENLVAIRCDILEPDLGRLREFIPEEGFTACYHLAGIVNLGKDKDGSIWESNVRGTQNVIAFCARHDIGHLYFTSTAYTQGRNTYERSKARCEMLLAESDIPHVTIFKPSIIMGTGSHPYLGHFSQFVALMIKVHKRAEIIRRKIEGALRLPVLIPIFRVRGNPEGKLNLITVDAVTDAMSVIKKNGVYWLTNPKPPTLGQLAEWISESIMVDFKFLPDFRATPIEAQFMKMTAAFKPYLQGDNFPSNLKGSEPITKEFIHDTIKRSLLIHS